MGFTESIRICLNKYIDFNGRASRSEYWWFVLLTFVLGFIPVIGWILRLALLLPSLSVQVRRLHDMNRSAWWLLLLIPPITIIGAIILLIMSIFPGTPGPNRYGPDPLQSQQDPGGYPYTQSGDPYDPPPGGFGTTAQLPPQTSSAPTSGADPGQPRFCTQCGMQLQADASFCTLCGTAV